jgi:FMN-dependent dehydrogenase
MLGAGVGAKASSARNREPNKLTLNNALQYGPEMIVRPRWLAELWQGPLVIKGILRTDDARRAVDAGADAIVVSDHGGLALDGVPGSLRSLPSVVEAVGDQVEVSSTAAFAPAPTW